MQWIWTNLKLIYLPEVDVKNENTSHAQATFLDLQLISVHDAVYLYKKWRSTIKNVFLHFLISKTNLPLQSFLRNLLLTECWCWVQGLTIKIHWKQQGILLESRLILITWSVREKKTLQTNWERQRTCLFAGEKLISRFELSSISPHPSDVQRAPNRKS